MLGILSFTLIKDKPVVSKTAAKVVKLPNCVADIANGAGTNPIHVSWSPGSITITWDHTGSPDHYNYGGYGVVTAGSTFTNSKTYSIGAGTSRFGVVCACSDGSTVGSSHGVLFSSTGYSTF